MPWYVQVQEQDLAGAVESYGRNWQLEALVQAEAVYKLQCEGQLVSVQVLLVKDCVDEKERENKLRVPDELA